MWTAGERRYGYLVKAFRLVHAKMKAEPLTASCLPSQLVHQDCRGELSSPTLECFAPRLFGRRWRSSLVGFHRWPRRLSKPMGHLASSSVPSSTPTIQQRHQVIYPSTGLASLHFPYWGVALKENRNQSEHALLEVSRSRFQAHTLFEEEHTRRLQDGHGQLACSSIRTPLFGEELDAANLSGWNQNTTFCNFLPSVLFIQSIHALDIDVPLLGIGRCKGPGAAEAGYLASIFQRDDHPARIEPSKCLIPRSGHNIDDADSELNQNSTGPTFARIQPKQKAEKRRAYNDPPEPTANLLILCNGSNVERADKGR